MTTTTTALETYRSAYRSLAGLNGPKFMAAHAANKAALASAIAAGATENECDDVARQINSAPKSPKVAVVAKPRPACCSDCGARLSNVAQCYACGWSI